MAETLAGRAPGDGGWAARVVGLDISLTATGIAHSAGWCRTVGWTGKPITRLPHAERAAAMRSVASGVLRTIGVADLVVVETPAYSRSGGGAHERGWLWWELYIGLGNYGIPVASMGPGQRAMYATGRGNATKGAVVDAVARRWPSWSTGGDDNQADAVALMAAGCDWLGQPIVTVPQTHRRALEGADWPATLAAGAGR